MASSSFQGKMSEYDDQPESQKMKWEKSEACGSMKLLSYKQNNSVKMSIEWTLTYLPDLLNFLKTSKKTVKSDKCIAPGEEGSWTMLLNVSKKKSELFLNVCVVYPSFPDGDRYVANCALGITYESNFCIKESPRAIELSIRENVNNIVMYYGFQISMELGRFLSDSSLMMKDDKLVICSQLNYCRASEGNHLFLETPICLELQEPVGLNKDLMDLYSTMNLSDVSFKFQDGVELFGHKSILGARSPVFAAMFTNDMKEKLVDYVEINDIDPEVFQDFLFFCYTDKFIESESMAKLLLLVADKYLVEQLKTKCENVLISKLTVENCPELLVLSDRHSTEKLKTSALKFFIKFAPKVIKTTGWKEMKKDSPSLCSEMLELIVLSKE